jgi:uncharacterized protein (TIGR02466 family)
MKSSIVTGGSDRHAELPSLLKQAMALHRFGLLHSQRGDYPTAIALMQESLRLFPGQPDVANDLGNAVKRSGNPETALGWYRHALELQPHYVDAWRNLGLCQLSLEQVEAAISSFERCLEIDTRDAVAWICLGRCYETALELRPDYAEAHHNLGLCRRLQLQPRDALKHYETARELGLDRAELYLNIGNALADTQDELAAIDAYRSAVIRNPLDLDSHRNLNSLLWQHELLDDHLASYRDALQREPGAEAIRRAYAIALNQTEDFEEAERVLEEGLRLAPQSAELKTLLGFALEGQGRWDEALRAHAKAVSLPGADPNHEINYARALLACKRPEEALPHAELGAVRMPFNQRALAYLGLCWRLLGDERDAIMNDYESLVGVYDLPIPPAYADSEAFNDQLAGVLNRLHVHKRHPPEQTLRGGSQTTGDLFDRTEPEIRELISGLEECIRTYTSRFPVDSEHPLFTRRKDEFHFAASWSVRLTRDGYHTMHIHPLGWISSAYYVQVPAEVAESDEFGGGLKFGEPDIDIGPEGAARRHVQPRAGRLALFPSYMWHGTIPFRSDEPRMTVAFDVVPEKQ